MDSIAGAELTALSAKEIVKRVTAREVAPTEIVDAFLARIEARDDELHAFLTVTAERAREEARLVQERLASGELPGLLQGVPYSLKDLTPVQGEPCTLGSLLAKDFIAPFDEAVVERLRGAGGVLVGKTNTPEFGTKVTTDNRLGPPTRNPWNVERTAGGSSGGAAAAVAAGLCPIAEGSDGAGSIRIPSACCGVVGLKPSRGRISMAPVLGEAYAGMATGGPITRTVEDAALMLDVMAGYEAGDPYWAPPPVEPFRQAVKRRPAGLRVALATTAPDAETHPEVAEAVERAAKQFEHMGHVVEYADPPFAGLAETYELLFQVSVAALPLELVSSDAPDEAVFTEWVQWLRAKGRAVRADEYVKALARMHYHGRVMVQFFESYDALLTPTLTRPAERLDWDPRPFEDTFLKHWFRWLPFTYVFNASGQPAISIPAGWSTEGLPIGLQIVGRPADDATVLTLAAQFEEAAPWAHRWPPN